MSFPVRVRLLTMLKGRLSAVIAQLMPNVYEEGRGGRQELELPSPSSLFVKVKRLYLKMVLLKLTRPLRNMLFKDFFLTVIYLLFL